MSPNLFLDRNTFFQLFQLKKIDAPLPPFIKLMKINEYLLNLSKRVC